MYFSKQAEKFLKKQSLSARNRILTAIHSLPTGDVIKLQGKSGYRLRVGNFRIIFDRNGNILYISRIGNRGQVYKEG
ncbi:MAG: type II toxin-antitoxin system RelE/ParE family toxin [Lachnospiraceae bacterium]|nr:type II toxin-antitoxin system RelE/ParE family toxin [Lachnospiraceae bacterium]